MTTTLLRGNALALPLADNTVDLIVTSPPYFGLRSYQDDGEHYSGQIGSEPTPAEFVDALIAATREMVRVLKPSGSIFVNLGDKYVRRSLLLLPQRYVLRCADELGVTVRAEMVWSKPNAFIDAKASGRVRRTHETWWHLAPSSRPFHTESIRRPSLTPYTDRPQYRRAEELFAAAGLTKAHRNAVRAVGIIDSPGGRVRSGGSWSSVSGQLAAEVHAALGSYYRELCGTTDEPAGLMPASVWPVAAQPLKVPKYLALEGHFSSFPIRFPAAMIQGWSEEGMVVLDPFSGTGTTALVAHVLGRHGISIDASPDYCRLARWRTTDPGERAKAMQVDKPPAEVSGQADLFDGQADLFGGAA